MVSEQWYEYLFFQAVQIGIAPRERGIIGYVHQAHGTARVHLPGGACRNRVAVGECKLLAMAIRAR